MMTYESSLDRDPGARYRRNTVTGEVERIDMDGVSGDPMMSPATTAGGEMPSLIAMGSTDSLGDSDAADASESATKMPQLGSKPAKKTRLQRIADWFLYNLDKGTPARRLAARKAAGRPVRESSRVITRRQAGDRSQGRKRDRKQERRLDRISRNRHR